MSKADILRVPDYLEHIVKAIERIYRYIEDIDEPAFLQDEKTQDASEILRLSVKRPVISNAIITSLPVVIRKFLEH
ncbi:MAG: hypothetical protein NTY50_10800 [Methylobacter sp.]|nr:hypothetical protein [Methylobacter sp.]